MAHGETRLLLSESDRLAVDLELQKQFAPFKSHAMLRTGTLSPSVPARKDMQSELQ